MPSSPMKHARWNASPPSPSRRSENLLPSRAPRKSRTSDLASLVPRVAPPVLAVNLKEVEREQKRIARAQAANRSPQAVEVRHAVRPADHALAVDGHGLHPQFGQRL